VPLNDRVPIDSASGADRPSDRTLKIDRLFVQASAEGRVEIRTQRHKDAESVEFAESALRGRSRTNRFEDDRRRHMKALFGIYLTGIVLTVSYFVVIGLSHH